MTKQEFIQEIAKYVKKYAPQFNIQVYSPIIAQACLESAYGTSAKAAHHNYFGLKYRINRVTCNSGYFRDGGSEQNADGSYRPISDDWYAFSDIEHGVLGYFQFINIPNYANLKGITSPLEYLTKIREDHYATSLNYVQNNMKVINEWNLTQYDPVKPQPQQKEEFTNSPLVTYTKISPNKTSPRNHKIDTITIHCMAGNLTVESCGNIFANPARKASSNYGIGTDGRVALYVDEKDRSWCSSNGANDNRAITIEVANDGGAPDWHVSDKALESLIKLCADICKRNNIKELKWKADKTLIGQVDKQNMTVHRWFAAKACPGDYLFNLHGHIAEQVNKILGTGGNPTPVTPEPTPAFQPYLVKVAVNALNIRSGPGTKYAKVGCIKTYGIYTIVEEQDGWGLLKSYQKNKDGWIKLSYTEKQ